MHDMTTLAMIHLSPWLTIPAAAVLALWLAWYWRRLGDDAVPETRRRIRRASIIVMFVTVIVIVRGLSFVDDATDPSNYTITWAMAITLVMLTLFTAFLDMLNNLRIHRREHSVAMQSSRERLTRDVESAGDARLKDDSTNASSTEESDASE